MILEYLKTSSTSSQIKADIPASIDLFNYNSAEYGFSILALYARNVNKESTDKKSKKRGKLLDGCVISHS